MCRVCTLQDTAARDTYPLPAENCATLPPPVRYYSGTPLYPFGFGLSYANFTYSSLVISPSVVKSDQESVVVSGTLTHTGGQASDEVVQVYVRCIFGVP